MPFLSRCMCTEEHVGHFGNVTPADQIKDGISIGSMHERRAVCNYSFIVCLGVLKLKEMDFCTVQSLEMNAGCISSSQRQSKEWWHSSSPKSKKPHTSTIGGIINAYALLGLWRVSTGTLHVQRNSYQQRSVPWSDWEPIEICSRVKTSQFSQSWCVVIER